MKKSTNEQKNHEAFIIAFENSNRLVNAEEKQKPSVVLECDSFRLTIFQN